MTNTSPGKFKQLRTEYHWHLCTKVLGNRGKHIGINVADTSSKSSRMLARLMVEKMGHGLCQKPPVDQTAGSLFGQYTTEYIQNAFSLLNHLRPGKWVYTDTGAAGIASFDQHQYLMDLKKVLDENPKVKAALGGDYLILPDVIIAREPVMDDEINESQKLIGNKDDQIVCLSPFRAANQAGEAAPILHAIISCKWTMRSDRAQNTRTEALNLIRNRKGPTPRIVAVTLEPLPTRLASIAMGTGDIDCTYHGALHELVEAAEESDLEDQVDMLRTLVEGRRLRDISDLPLDLAI
jgi:hypothetical protein